VAVKGSLAGFPYVLSLAVLLWVAGFDMVYACMDVDFDRREGLYSLPVVLGRRWSFRLAAIFHFLAFLLFLATGIFSHLSSPYYIGLAIAACCLIYQHIIVKPDDLSKIKVSFFQMNGLVSLILFFSTWLALSA